MDLDEVFQRFTRQQIIDVQHGGLVLGRPEFVDDIPILQITDGNLLRAVGVMMGGEYILSADSFEAHREEVVELNSEKGDAEQLPALNLSEAGNIFDTNLGKPLDGLWHQSAVWVDVRGQFIVNRFATRKHLARLIEMNRMP